MQLSLFEHVKTAYAASESGTLGNEELYQRVASTAGITDELLERVAFIGKDQRPHKPIKRAIRWCQQDLRRLGLIQGSGRRGEWELTGKGKVELRKIKLGSSLLAFSTELGAAMWSLSHDVFSQLNMPITLCLTSPPYPLKKSRAYGNVTLENYIEFAVESVRPLAKHLEPGGSICLNLSNDIFEPGIPARSTYREKLVLAMVEELGLWKMDELIWESGTKPPGPVQYASITRQQLNVGFEVIYWFTNNPKLCKADNRRVLEPHTESHLK